MSQIHIRSAQIEDRTAVLAFCHNTWDWGDYIERVWDEWSHNANGQLLVALDDTQPVGIVFLQMLDPDEAWLQGLRVDPTYRRLGIARALSEAAMLEAMRRGAQYLRLVTEADNHSAIQLYQSMHMRRVGTFSLYDALPLITTPANSVSERTQLATIADLNEIIDYLNVSNIFPIVGGLYYKRFIAYPITAAFLTTQITAGSLYLLRRWDRLDGLAIAEIQQIRDQEARQLSVGYLDGTTIEAISFIAYDLRRRLQAMELANIRVYAPDFVLIHDALGGIDYTSNELYYSYERGLT